MASTITQELKSNGLDCTLKTLASAHQEFHSVNKFDPKAYGTGNFFVTFGIDCSSNELVKTVHGFGEDRKQLLPAMQDLQKRFGFKFDEAKSEDDETIAAFITAVFEVNHITLACMQVPFLEWLKEKHSDMLQEMVSSLVGQKISSRGCFFDDDKEKGTSKALQVVKLSNGVLENLLNALFSLRQWDLQEIRQGFQNKPNLHVNGILPIRMSLIDYVVNAGVVRVKGVGMTETVPAYNDRLKSIAKKLFQDGMVATEQEALMIAGKENCRNVILSGH